jgi:carboxypeptidase A1
MIYSKFIFYIGASLAYVNYEGQEIWSCESSNQDIAEKLHKYDVFNHKNGVTTLRLMNDKEKDQVKSYTSCTVIERDLNKYIANYRSRNATFLASESRSGPMLDDEYFKDYRSYDQIKTQYRHWADKYSKYAKFIDVIGKTHEGRDIFAIEITANNPYRKTKKNIMYTGGQHAREWISPATVAYISYSMLKEADSNEQVKDHLQNFVYKIVPIVNPDGYEYSRSSDRLWRKNRRDIGYGVYGVDLNRNWDYKWGLVGGSLIPTTETYQGPYAASEPEVQAVAGYMKKVGKAYGAIDWHSYSQVAGWSWGWTPLPSSNNEILKKMGDSVVAAINKHGYSFTSQQSSNLGVASGAADDYMAVKLEAVSMTMELCPDPNDDAGFVLPPDQILKCAPAAYDGHKAFAQFLIDNPSIPPIKDIPPSTLSRYKL